MVKFGSKNKKAKVVFLSSLATSLVIMNLFLLAAIITNMSKGEIAYTQVDIAAGSIFVFVISMIISMSIWPKILEKIESKEKNY
jgi:membrane protein YdbS with pleckstrin-like domain